MGNERPDSYENRTAVVQHLQARGFKVGKSKIYEDAKSGLLRVQPDGTVLGSDLELYIKACLVGRRQPSNEGELARKKLELEVQKLENQVREQNLEYEKSIGKLIDRRDVELELAARAAVLSAGLETMVYARSAEWIFLVQGKPEFSAKLAEEMIQSFRDTLNDYAQIKTFQVLFETDDDTL